ncbi:MAG: DNA-3-methyladenine glycosylase [Spirochaetales bacterium]
MNYLKEKNKITIYDIDSFNVTHIFECGQVFRYTKTDEYYEAVSKDQIARVYSYENRVEILCSDEDYFENYFDLKTDYKQIKNSLKAFKIDALNMAIDYGYGIRILRQDELETIISFIISANNNIKRIQGSLKKLSERFGTKLKSKIFGEYYAFPTLKQLSKINEAQFVELGTGYRAGQLVKAILQLQNMNLKNVYNLSTNTATNTFIEMSGIGPKVADCVLLFGYYKMDVFPVDTWIEKVFNHYFCNGNPLTNRPLIRKELVKIFDGLSGYAQQYLFYYERTQK